MKGKYTMQRKQYLLLAMLFLLLTVPVLATDRSVKMKDFAQNAYPGATVCFSEEDILNNTLSDKRPSGLVIAGLPRENVGLLRLGEKILREGDMIPTGKIDTLSFAPAVSSEFSAEISLIPVTENRDFSSGGKPITLTLNFSKDLNSPPVAASFTCQTYENMPIYIDLAATDHDGDGLSYSVISCGEKGTLSLSGERLVFTPAERSTGKATIRFFARDSAGNTSLPGEVTVEIKKRRTDFNYSDISDPCHGYAAVRLAEEGIYVGEQYGSLNVLSPHRGFTKTEFAAICSAALELEQTAPSAQISGDMSTWESPFFPIALSAAKLDGSDISKPVTGKSGAYIALTLLKQSTDCDDLDLTALYGPWLNDDPLTRDAALELIHRTAELSKTFE